MTRPPEIPAFIRENRCQTRDGRPVRVLCCDLRNDRFPVAYEVPTGISHSPKLRCVSPSGSYLNHPTMLHDFDLVELPEPAGDWATEAAKEIVTFLVDGCDFRHEEWPVIQAELSALIRRNKPQPPRSEASTPTLPEGVPVPPEKGGAQ